MRLHAGDQCNLTPLPMTIDVDEADLPQPCELRLPVQKFVGGIFLLGQNLQLLEELMVKPHSRRRDVLQIAKCPPGNRMSNISE